MDPSEQTLQRAISTIAQSDPIVKLLQQVRLGKMKSTDAGLRAVTESWLATYQKAVGTDGLTKQALRRIDPAPRIRLLVQHGVVTADHPAVMALRASFEQARARAVE
jgi:hypothetical protein